jgi:hypothetical protein
MVIQPTRTWRLGPQFFIRAPDGTPLSAAIDLVFGRMLVAEPPPEHALCVLLDARRAGAGWQLYADGVPIVRACADNNLPPVVESAMTLCAVRNWTDSMAFHAGCVEISGRGVLILGQKSSGKSTLSLSLAHRGARYLGDEVVFVGLDDKCIRAFPKAATLKEGSFPLFAEGPTWYSPLRGALRYYQAPDPAPAFHSLPKADLIVLPSYQPSAELSITELARHETALILLQQCFGGVGRYEKSLGIVADISRTRACLVEYPSAPDATAAVIHLANEGGG